jgi:pimeloyl-ACP methyl ester carboxylesterase
MPRLLLPRTTQRGIAYTIKTPAKSLVSGTVFLTHGNGLCKEVLNPICSLLPNYYTVQIDLTGHGSSRKPPNDEFQAQDFGADVLSVVDEFSQEFPSSKPHMACSHSMGATSTLWAIHLRPGVFQRALLAEPILHKRTPNPEYMRNTKLTQMTLKRRSSFDSLEACRLAWRGRGVFKTWTDEAFEGMMQGGLRKSNEEDAGGKVHLACDLTWEAANYQRDFSLLWRELQNERVALPAEVRLFCGQKSDTYDHVEGFEGTADFMKQLHAHLKLKTPLVIVPGATHSLPMEMPDVFAKAFIRPLERF